MALQSLNTAGEPRLGYADGIGLARALAQTAELAAKAHARANEPFQFKIDGLPRQRFVSFKGEISAHEVDPPAKQLTAGDLRSFVALVQLYAEAALRPTVWHDGDQVELVLDDKWRSDRVVCELEPTTVRTAIAELGEGLVDQEQFIRLLRTSLKNTELERVYLPVIRSINFIRNEEQQTTIQPTGHTLGASVMRKAAGLPDNLPDLVETAFPWWATEILNSEVTAAVYFEVNFAAKKFFLEPSADDLEQARQYVQGQLHDWLSAQLAEVGVPVFHGAP